MRPSEPTRNPTQEDSRLKVESVIQDIIESLLEVGITAHDFQPESGGVLDGRINKLNDNYKKLLELKDAVDIDIPVDVLRQIESGKNPENFTKDFTEKIISERQFTNNKIQGLVDFKAELESELASIFTSVEEKAGNVGSK
ncbi:RNA polymerase II mediator complex subunit [Mycoemilia scoparia]|uniref:Mediator of RNA polymerase II transcription subunit 10 n=1 Tax=Mycoemilia scoparia TaxID=417184 RepID=A0A9W7ZXA0_9FUNG|nr:RNA polymerase II mediator complex subunit [Mycoemilia scoparia]